MSDAVALEARAWVLLLLSGMATHEDALVLKHWRSADPCHELAFRTEGRLLKLARRAAGELREEEMSPPASRHRGVSRRLIVGGALAASAAGVAFMAGRDGMGPIGAPSADFVTGKGETRQVDLGTGVSVEMNTLTRIARRPRSGDGAFELLTGEVVVSVDQRVAPLAVVAEDGETRTLGGKLSFRCLGGEVRVSCLDGSADVRLKGRGTTVPVGHSLTYARGVIHAVTAIDPATEAAWRHGLLIFRNRRLGDVIEEINRYRDGRIVIADPRLSDRRVNGAFHTNRIDQIIDQIKLAYGVRATRLPGDVVLLA